MIHSYPSIYNLGHAAVATLLHGPVIIEEKIDGSQISFCRCVGNPGDPLETWEPQLRIRSKGAQINLLAPEGLFKKAVEFLQSIEDKIPVGYTFRGEYLSKPAHNVLNYDRVPNNHIIIFDIEKPIPTVDQIGMAMPDEYPAGMAEAFHKDWQSGFLNPTEKKDLAATLGFETVPALNIGKIETADEIRALLERTSILGGQKVEGVVIKPANYDLYGRDKKVVMGKFVSEAFKETHAAEWKALHGPKSSNDVLRELSVTYASPARWQKALIHLREEGKITDSLKDIGELFKAVPTDVRKECEEEIKATLWKWAWPNLCRSVTRGLPEWYKDLLLKKQFEPVEEIMLAEVDRLENEGGPVDPAAFGNV